MKVVFGLAANEKPFKTKKIQSKPDAEVIRATLRSFS